MARNSIFGIKTPRLLHVRALIFIFSAWSQTTTYSSFKESVFVARGTSGSSSTSIAARALPSILLCPPSCFQKLMFLPDLKCAPLTPAPSYTGTHDALLTPQIWHLLCHSISRVNNSVLVLQTGSAASPVQTVSPAFPLDLDAMRASFESHGIHRSRLMFVQRPAQSQHAGLLMSAAAAAAADVVVDFSASCVYSLAAAAPVSGCTPASAQGCDPASCQVVTAPLDLPTHRVAGAVLIRVPCLAPHSPQACIFCHKMILMSLAHTASQRHCSLGCASLRSSAGLPATSKTPWFRCWGQPPNASVCRVILLRQ
jgi:hypothetical protein